MIKPVLRQNYISVKHRFGLQKLTTANTGTGASNVDEGILSRILAFDCGHGSAQD